MELGRRVEPLETLDVILSAEELIGGFSAERMISSDINFKMVLHCVEKG